MPRECCGYGMLSLGGVMHSRSSCFVGMEQATNETDLRNAENREVFRSSERQERRWLRSEQRTAGIANTWHVRGRRTWHTSYGQKSVVNARMMSQDQTSRVG